MEHWDKLDFTILKVPFTSEKEAGITFLSWEGGSRSRHN